MKSRLDALLRQRELLREHAQWLDGEIAAERARRGEAVASPATAAANAPAAPGSTSVAADPAHTAAILPVEADVKNLHNEVRRGCMLYFVLALAALVGLVAFVYWKYDSAPEDLPLPSHTPATAPTPGESAPPP